MFAGADVVRRRKPAARISLVTAVVAALVLALAVPAAADIRFDFDAPVVWVVANCPTFGATIKAHLTVIYDSDNGLEYTLGRSETDAYNTPSGYASCGSVFNEPQNWLSTQAILWAATSQDGMGAGICQKTTVGGNQGGTWYAVRANNPAWLNCHAYSNIQGHGGAFTWPGAWNYKDTWTGWWDFNG